MCIPAVEKESLQVFLTDSYLEYISWKHERRKKLTDAHAVLCGCINVSLLGRVTVLHSSYSTFTISVIFPFNFHPSLQTSSSTFLLLFEEEKDSSWIT